MTQTPTHPDLEQRFLEPEGWRWHRVKRNEHKLRFGTVSPKNSIPDAVIVCLPGLNEFCEKYFEIARHMLDRNYAFWVIDWKGQGLSDRHLENRIKRHSNGFQNDVDDLHEFIMGYIKHSSVHPDKGRIPLAMLAHSMGGNIGLQYIQQHPDMFECAAFSAPMIDIHALHNIPKPFRSLLSKTLNTVMGERFSSPDGQQTIRKNQTFKDNTLTSDEHRFALMHSWMNFNEDLRVGDVTYGWAHHALKACNTVQKTLFLKSIDTKCLFATAGNEVIVSNKAIKRIVPTMPNAELLNLEASQHEILMEEDDIRQQFLDAFDKLVKETIIDRPETLKPF